MQSTKTYLDTRVQECTQSTRDVQECVRCTQKTIIWWLMSLSHYNHIQMRYSYCLYNSYRHILSQERWKTCHFTTPPHQLWSHLTRQLPIPSWWSLRSLGFLRIVSSDQYSLPFGGRGFGPESRSSLAVSPEPRFSWGIVDSEACPVSKFSSTLYLGLSYSMCPRQTGPLGQNLNYTLL